MKTWTGVWVFLFSCYTAPLWAAPKNVLVLYSYDASLPSNILAERGIQDVFSKSGLSLVFYQEYMDTRRFSGTEYSQQLQAIYQSKYRQHKPDVIIAVMDNALDFVLRHSDTTFAGVPVVFGVMSEEEIARRALPPHVTGATRVFDFASTLQLALQLQPNTRLVAVVSEPDDYPSSMLGFVREAFQPFTGQLAFRYFPHQSLAVWQEELARLPPDSIIFYVNLWQPQGPDGALYTPAQALDAIASRANAPIYGIFDSYLGHGMVGGLLSSYEEQGRAAARLALRVLGGEKPQNIPISKVPLVDMFDWPQLQRWRIPLSRLPTDSFIKDQPPSLWQAYKEWIIGGIVVIASESLLLITLLIQRKIRRRAEQALVQLNLSLEEKVENRTHALQESRQHMEMALEAANAANQAKSVFLASMSHELRTPLNAILGYARILQRNPEKLAEGLHTINHSGEHLLGLINELLDLAKIESGKLELQKQPVILPALLREALDMVRQRAEAKGLALVLENGGGLPEVVETDEKRLRQVLLNLLGNAVKFTAQGRVSLRVTTGATPGALHFFVEDTGAGISQEEQSKIFHAFEQGQAARQRGEGVGLGLHISRLLVRMMGGELQVQSAPGQGSCFSFTLTLPVLEHAAQPAQAARAPAIGYSGPRRHILIVDDKPDNLAVLRALLEIAGFQVSEAHNGLEAVAQVETEKPDLVLMDLMMPELDGFEATRQIHALPGLADLPVVAVSASAPDAANSTEFSDFLHKPLDEDKLWECLQRLLHLEWQYAEAPVTTEGLRIPPAEQLRELRELAKQAKVSRIQAWAEKLAPECSVFADQVRALAWEFDSAGLVKLAEKYL